MFSYADARSNFELQPEEYINLTYLNSVWLEWAVTTKNLGGWTVGGKEVTYAYAIKYIKTALDSFGSGKRRKRRTWTLWTAPLLRTGLAAAAERVEAGEGVRQITPYQAKRFSKYYREEAEK